MRNQAFVRKKEALFDKKKRTDNGKIFLSKQFFFLN
jgi:hypothetical protein